jgi:hypothetical protein
VAGISAVDAGPDTRRLGGSLLAGLLLGLLVVLLVTELVLLTSTGELPHADATDVAAAQSFALGIGPERIARDRKVLSSQIVVGPRVQTVANGWATFLVVLDQTVTSEGSQAQPQLVRVGLLVKVQEKDHKVASVQVL